MVVQTCENLIGKLSEIEKHLSLHEELVNHVSNEVNVEKVLSKLITLLNSN